MNQNKKSLFDRWLVPEFILDLVFPKLCVSCDAEGSYFCIQCQGLLEESPSRCLVCDKNSLLGKIHNTCQSSETAIAGLMVGSLYNDSSVKKLLWHLKYKNIQDISEFLALILVDFIIRQDLSEYFQDTIVVPVPLSPRRLRERGYNQSFLIGEKFARRLELPFAMLLKKIRNTKNQVELSREERLQNLAGVFVFDTDQVLEKNKVILVDDVATTGATINECAKALKIQKPSIEVWGLVVARNPL